MSPDLDAKLCTDFPLLYSVRYVSTRDTLSHVGIETGDSWFDIIYELAVKLENLTEKLPRKNETAITLCRLKRSLPC
jgi:hypothetical protein